MKTYPKDLPVFDEIAIKTAQEVRVFNFYEESEITAISDETKAIDFNLNNGNEVFIEIQVIAKRHGTGEVSQIDGIKDYSSYVSEVVIKNFTEFKDGELVTNCISVRQLENKIKDLLNE